MRILQNILVLTGGKDKKIREVVCTGGNIPGNVPIPPEWQSLGLTSNLSYNQTVSIMKNLKLKVFDYNSGKKISNSFFYRHLHVVGATGNDWYLEIDFEKHGIDDIQQAMEMPGTMTRIELKKLKGHAKRIRRNNIGLLH